MVLGKPVIKVASATYALKSTVQSFLAKRDVNHAAGRVMVNDKVVKASYDVKLGDVIEISFGNKSVKVKVTMIADSTKMEDAKEMFEYL